MTSKISGKKLVICLMVITAVLITVTGIVYEQSLLRILPLYISLVIAFLQSRVNRFAPLLGGINSVLYAIVYLYYGLYASAIYAIIISGPLQILTFFCWRKRAYGQSVVLKHMNWKGRVANLIAFSFALAALHWIMSALGSNHTLFDNLSSLLGGWVTVLTLFAYVEYTWLMIPAGLCNIGLYISMLEETPEQMTYLIYAIYGLVCSSIAVFQARKLWNAQNSSTKSIEETM